MITIKVIQLNISINYLKQTGAMLLMKKKFLIWYIPLFVIYMLLTGDDGQIPRFTRTIINEE